MWIKFAIDLGVWSLATPLAFLLRLDYEVGAYGGEILVLFLLGLPIRAIAIVVPKLPWRSWSRVAIGDLRVLIQAVGIATIAWVAILFFLPLRIEIPRSVPVIEALLAVIGLCAVRLAARFWFEALQSRPGRRRAGESNVLIVGAGEAGVMIAREMLHHSEGGYIPCGFLDDDPAKQHKQYTGVRVLGCIEDLPQVLALYRIDEVLIALPSQGGKVIRRVVELARVAKVKHRIIPSFYELLSEQVSIAKIREVNLEDLLRREPVRLETDAISELIQDKTILITGAGGSIGSEIVRQVAFFNPGALLLLGRGENSIHKIDLELSRSHPERSRHPLITDVRDEGSLRDVFERFRPDVVFHAAAHKHVPLMEANPAQAVFNNVEGTRNLIRLALEFDVRRFVNISTDKAVSPTSVMGAVKRVTEHVVCSAAETCRPHQAFVSVRFGNVLGSRGSVVPIFQDQIRNGGPVTVTHPEMQRYFMTVSEATQLVLQAGSMAVNGCVYVLDMGKPVRIVDLAHDLIRLFGKEPGVDIEIEFTGIRPGEKLFEELFVEEEGIVPSEHEKIFVARQSDLHREDLDAILDELRNAATSREFDRIRAVLKRLVPSYTPHVGNSSTSIEEQSRADEPESSTDEAADGAARTQPSHTIPEPVGSGRTRMRKPSEKATQSDG